MLLMIQKDSGLKPIINSAIFKNKLELETAV